MMTTMMVVGSPNTRFESSNGVDGKSDADKYDIPADSNGAATEGDDEADEAGAGAYADGDDDDAEDDDDKEEDVYEVCCCG